MTKARLKQFYIGVNALALVMELVLTVVGLLSNIADYSSGYAAAAAACGYPAQAFGARLTALLSVFVYSISGAIDMFGDDSRQYCLKLRTAALLCCVLDIVGSFVMMCALASGMGIPGPVMTGWLILFITLMLPRLFWWIVNAATRSSRAAVASSLKGRVLVDRVI